MANAEKTVMFALPNALAGQLACVAGTAAGRSWDLSAGTFVIGRVDDSDLALPSEPGVSKTHAKIIGQGERYLIMDCESRNGTLVNGQLVQRADLYDGDEIKICGCTLRFTQKGGPSRPRPREPVAAAPVVATSAAVAGPATDMLPMQQLQQAQVAPTGVGKVLAAWYAAGLAGTLLLGGAASAVAVVVSPPLAPAIPAVAVVVAPVVPVAVAPVVPVAVPPVVPAVDPAVPVAPAEVPAVPVVADAVPVPVVPEPVAAVVAAAVPEPEPEPVAEIEAAAAPTGRARKPRKPREAPPVVAEAAAAAASTEGSERTYPAVVDGGKSEQLKTRTGGRVKTVDAKDGDVVVKGQVLVTFESGSDPAEVATLQDRIASLENAEDDEAKRELRQAKQKLAAIEGGQKAQPIAAGLDGKLIGFNPVVGSVLRAGETLGKVADGDVPSRVRITVAKGTRISKGQIVQIVLRNGGTAEGSVVAVSGRTVVVDTGSEAGDAVEAVRF
ncbi:MAG: FHA domain-containing protein [Deltaproteobacteria bacterium]|nr:FHA domain-containing protein [Deltaproteobacteria bacterium]